MTFGRGGLILQPYQFKLVFVFIIGAGNSAMDVARTVI